MYIAHKNEKTGEVQTLKEHSENTAKICREFAISELKDEFYVMGLLHDIGKYQKSFVRRINGARVQVEHSICGAKLIEEKFHNIQPISLLIEYCIAGHHSGLPNGGFKSDDRTQSTLSGRLKRETEDYSAYKCELNIPNLADSNFRGLLCQNLSENKKIAIEQVIDKFAFFTKYAFSCLVDADSIDTASFCGDDPFRRPLLANFKSCLQDVEKRLSEFVCKTELQKARKRLQEQAFTNIKNDAEIYTMNMPTGSGKTLCSIKCALEKAITENKKRIIYVIPYNSIIDQTAEVFAEIFGPDAEILRHQSTYSFEDSGADDDLIYGENRAAENWNAPIIITTAVQFFGSLLSNKRGKLRKVHNMQDSIIVFDEAHLMPENFLQPCLQAVGYITKYLSSKAVFLTATMPNFADLMSRYVMENNKILPLITDTSDFKQFQKCRFEYLGEISLQYLMAKSKNSPSTLIILNTRKLAREVYHECTGKKYHLSTYMTVSERIKILNEIRCELSNLERDYPTPEEVPEDRRITIVSTSLIEAGVDLDVFTVFRQISGLDSILQAAGRCNREGKRKDAVSYIFEYEDSRSKPSRDVKINITRGLLKKYDDISNPECINEYYEKLFFTRDEKITQNTIHKKYVDFTTIGFKEYAEKMDIIDSNAISIVVPTDEKAKALVEHLKLTKHANIRSLQKYTCSVYQKELETLIKQHAVSDYGSGIFCLRNLDYYDYNIGIMFEAKDYII